MDLPITEVSKCAVEDLPVVPGASIAQPGANPRPRQGRMARGHKVARCYVSVDAMTRATQVREDQSPYGG